MHGAISHHLKYKFLARLIFFSLSPVSAMRRVCVWRVEIQMSRLEVSSLRFSEQI